MQEVEKKIAALEAQVLDLKKQIGTQDKPPADRATLLLFNGDLDKAIAAFIIANGAAASDMEVDIFVTFWGISVFRDPKKGVKKNLLASAFDRMLPRGSKKLKLSQMEMGGDGLQDDSWINEKKACSVIGRVD